MESTYAFMRWLAGSWGLVLMVVVFASAILWAFRPGTRALHADAAAVPFRHEDRPAPQPVAKRDLRVPSLAAQPAKASCGAGCADCQCRDPQS